MYTLGLGLLYGWTRDNSAQKSDTRPVPYGGEDRSLDICGMPYSKGHPLTLPPVNIVVVFRAVVVAQSPRV